ncbi:MAG: dCTP deaminase [Chloroflexi bacterium]|nr:MAG: dCTP deaminase [Chloroflexota bacterium]
MKDNGKVVELERKDLKNKNNIKNRGVLSKEEIRKCISKGDIVIEPFDENTLGPSDINFRISENYARIKNIQEIMDLRNLESEIINGKYFTFEKNKEYIIQPNEHLLIESIEYLEMPNYLTALIALRSTFSRLGLSTPPTLIDPGFKGKIVFHLIGSSYPIKLYEGIAVFKIIFLYVSSNTEVYNGEYQNQKGVVLPKSYPIWGKRK